MRSAVPPPHYSSLQRDLAHLTRVLWRSRARLAIRSMPYQDRPVGATGRSVQLRDRASRTLSAVRRPARRNCVPARATARSGLLAWWPGADRGRRRRRQIALDLGVLRFAYQLEMADRVRALPRIRSSAVRPDPRGPRASRSESVSVRSCRYEGRVARRNRGTFRVDRFAKGAGHGRRGSALG